MVAVACKVPNGIRFDENTVVTGPMQVDDPSQKPGGFAITVVPDKVWEDWLERNKDATIVEKNMIFARPTEEEARVEARRKNRVRTGLEQNRVA